MYGPVFTRLFIYYYYYQYYVFFLEGEWGGACRLPEVSNYSLVSDRMVKQ